MIRTFSLLAILALIVPLAACDQDTPADPTTNNETPEQTGMTPATGDPFLLEAAPEGDPVEVSAALQAADGEVIVVRGVVKDINSGYFAGVVVDASVPSCIETDGPGGCATPWDYCCTPSAQLASNTLPVRFVNADGQPVARSSAPGFRRLDTLAIAGTLMTDEQGNRRFLATGYHIIDRPDLDHGYRWPENELGA